MPLRKPPTRTPAFLAAIRRNSLKSTGPRTPQGKRRVALNGLRHAHRSRRLEATLEGLRPLERREFARLYAVLYRALHPGPKDAGWVLPTAACIWRLKRAMERHVRSAEFKARLAENRGWLLRPSRWRLYPRGWRVTVTVWVRRSRGPSGHRVDPAAGCDGGRPLHVGVMICCSDGRRWERLELLGASRLAPKVGM